MDIARSSLTLPRTPAFAGSAVRVALQGIFTAERELVAHELLFRATGRARSADLQGRAEHDRATAQVICATFGDFSPHDLAGGKRLFLNTTRSFLVGDLPLPFPPGGTVLEVLETIDVDDELLTGLQLLRGRGHEIAVDDFDGDPGRLPAVRLADYVKIDLQAARETIDDLIAMVRAVNPTARLVVERVETQEDFDLCRGLGVDLFQGYLLHRPSTVEKQSLTPSRMNCLHLLTLLQDDRTSVDEVLDLLTRDPALSLRILRTVSSAAHAPTEGITSLEQAVVLLGRDQLVHWMTLLLVVGHESSQDVDDALVRIFTRATVCQLLAPGDGAAGYLVGLLSGVADTLAVPVLDIARGCTLSPDVLAALVKGEGHLGFVLRVASVHESAATTDDVPAVASWAYLRAMVDARTAVAALRHGPVGLSTRSQPSSRPWSVHRP